MPDTSITTPKPSAAADQKPIRQLSDAQLSAVVEAAYLLATSTR